MADDNLTIKTKIDSDGVKKGLSEIGSDAKEKVSEISRLIEKLNTEIKNGERTATSAASTLASAYKKTGMDSSEAMTQAWKDIERAGDSGEKELDDNFDGITLSAKTSGTNIKTHIVDALETIGSGIKKTAEIAAKVVAAAATAMGALAGYSINVGSSFEAGMSEVQAISGATGADLEALKDKAKEMGATTKFSATQSAEALKYMAMAGWDTEDMLGGLSGVMNLAAASGEDLGTVSDIVTDALTAFGLQASDSAHFADVLAKAASNSNTSVSMMGETFKYAAPLAGALGYSIEDIAIASGLMANAGIKATQAGTSLRSMFTRLSSPPADAAKAMDALGIRITDAEGNMKPLRETLEDLRNGFSGLSDAEKTEYASNIAGQEAMSGLLAIVNASDEDFASLAASIDDASGAAEKQAEIMQDNLTGAITILKSAAEGLGIEIYESIQEPLKSVAKEATSMVDSLSKAFQTGGMEGLVNEAGNIIGKILTKFSQAAPQAIKVGSDFVVSIVKGLGKNSKQLAKAAVEIGKALIKGIGEILPEVAKAGQKIVVELARAILGENIANKISGFFDDINDAFGGLVSTIGAHTGDILDIVSDIVGVILDVADFVIPELITALDFVVDNIDILKPALEGLLAGIVAYKTVTTVTDIIGSLTGAFRLLTAAIAANPIAAAVGGIIAAIGLLATAQSALTETQEEYTDRVLQLTEAEKAEREEAQKRNEQYQEMVERSDELTAGIEAQASYENDLWKELQNITDENGKIKQGYEERAQVIATTLSEALGTEIEIVDGQIVKYDELKKSIEQVIQKKKAEALLSAYNERYSEAVQKQTEAQQAYNEQLAITQEAQKNYDEALAHLTDLQEQAANGVGLNANQHHALMMATQEATEELEKAQGTLNGEKNALADNLATLEGYTNDRANYERLMADSTAENWESMEKSVAALTAGLKSASTSNKDELEKQLQEQKEILSQMEEAWHNGEAGITEDMVIEQSKRVEFSAEQLGVTVDLYDANSKDAMEKWQQNIADGAPGSEAAAYQVKAATEKPINEVDLKTPGSEAMIDYNAAIKSGGDQAKRTATDIGQGIKRNVSVDLTSTGRSIAQGLVNGLGSMAGTVANAALALGQLAVSKVNQGADVHSPSRATIETGGYIDEGLIIGMQSGFGRVSAAAKQLGALALPRVPSPAVASLPIPRLATGTVIPPNSPYLALVGDQKKGTNIEAPLDTIKQAVRDVVGTGQNWKIVIPVYLEGRQVYEAVVEENNKNTMATGQNAMMGEI